MAGSMGPARRASKFSTARRLPDKRVHGAPSRGESSLADAQPTPGRARPGGDMFDRFTDRARKVMGLARQEAQRFNHDYIGTEHILLGLVQEGSGVAEIGRASCRERV